MVVCEVGVGEGEGMEVLGWMGKEGMREGLMMMRKYGEVDRGVESMKVGWVEYMGKEVVEDKVMGVVDRMVKEGSMGGNGMGVFGGESWGFEKMMEEIRLVGGSDMRVVILGEKGRGKEDMGEDVDDKRKRGGKGFVGVEWG